MGYSPDHKRMKPTYSPYLSASEKRHEQRVQEQPCYGCGRYSCEAHHTLLRFPEKRWRRDHRFRLPVCIECHRGPNGIHGIGREPKWLASIGKTEDEAIEYIKSLWAASEDEERRAV